MRDGPGVLQTTARLSVDQVRPGRSRILAHLPRNVFETVDARARLQPAISFFDEQTGRAGIYALCLALIVTAWGTRSWERNATFLDAGMLAIYFLSVSAIVVALLAADILLRAVHISSVADVAKYLRTSSPSWLDSVALITAWVVLPFLFASFVRTCAIWIMCNVFGAVPFGLASTEQISTYRENEERANGVLHLGQFFGLLLFF